MASFEKALDLDPEYATAYVMLGYTRLMEVAFGTSRDSQTLEQVSDLARKAISLGDTYFLAYVLLADVYRTKGQYEQAILQAERALALNPNDPAAYRGLGNALNSLGRFGEAIKSIKKAMRLDPHYAVYYSTDLASAYRNLGKYDEAIASLKEAIVRNPDWVPAYFELTMNYLMAWSVAQSRDPALIDKASETTEQLLASDPSSLYGHFALPLVGLYMRQPDKALADAKRLIALAPESADNYALMAAVLISAGKGEEAMGMVEKAMQLRKDAPAWYLNTLASANALTGREAEAIATHKRVFDGNPSHAAAYNAHLELTLLYAGSGQKAAARVEAQKILGLVPNFSVAIWGRRNPNTNQEQVEKGMEMLRSTGLN